MKHQEEQWPQNNGNKKKQSRYSSHNKGEYPDFHHERKQWKFRQKKQSVATTLKNTIEIDIEYNEYDYEYEYEYEYEFELWTANRGFVYIKPNFSFPGRKNIEMEIEIENYIEIEIENEN